MRLNSRLHIRNRTNTAIRHVDTRNLDIRYVDTRTLQHVDTRMSYSK
jgi:hypothetical protein